MTALEYILDGLEAELALERELGVRVIECDRGLLAKPAAGAANGTNRTSGTSGTSGTSATGEVARAANGTNRTSGTSGTSATGEGAGEVARATGEGAGATGEVASGQILDFAFIHDRPLAPAESEMMGKIVAALGKTPETAPVVVAPPMPRAKAYVVLGGLALRKWFPGVNAAPGQWVSTALSPNVLVTYSPAYILRFGTVTPKVMQLKKDMWLSIKSVLRRTQAIAGQSA